MWRSLILFLILQIFNTLIAKESIVIKTPISEKGILNLSSWDFNTDGPINLEGEWEFYWNELLDPNSPQSQSENQQTIKQFINIPSQWEKYLVNGKELGTKGYASYRLKVILPAYNEPLALKLLTFSSAYKLFVNGKFITEVGKVSKDESEGKPGYLPQVVYINGSNQTLDIIFQVSNFHHVKSGFWDQVKLGNHKSIQALRERNLFFQIFIFGALFMMCLYHLGLYSLRRTELAPLFFALFCFTFGFRSLLTGEMYWYQIFPDILWDIGLRLDYLTIFLAPSFFLLFLYSVFPRELPLLACRILVGSFLLLTLGAVFLPTILFTSTRIIDEILLIPSTITIIYTITLAIKRNRSGAKPF